MTFYEIFILSCYKSGYSMRMSTLYHLLKGKKTSSVLTYGYFYDNLNYFNLLPKLKEKSYYNLIEKLVQKECLIEVEKGILELSETGVRILDEKNFPTLSQLNQIEYYKYDTTFWEKIMFATQVISEKSYHEGKYIPIENNLFKQQQLKKWLKSHNETLPSQFYKEWEKVLDFIPEDKQVLLLGQLVGHNHIGLTLNQIAIERGQDYFYTYLEFKNYLHYFIQMIEEYLTEYPIFYELLALEKSLVKTDSSQVSNQLYRQYGSVSQVSRYRRLKESTVTDHLIESFLRQPSLSNLPDFNENTIVALERLKLSQPDFRRWLFKDACMYEPELSFYDFKCYQFYLIEKERFND
ncbi:RQC domain-containing protein [Vagococcus carniphilus]|uniref:RQC domain-containing protein n=2 Tax=Vagococcus carniphilus TaxID=218144 RepID=A0AAW8U3R2_9ENTE|nr:RQC domain-containing protein [Vagococcus carniphilus]MDT2829599.1 RQC domain-containing protein [Vagococcus carniphilus]MDT2833699.1 RQC domain-containing protein [Vagococcus carniphilus]MDT2839058.1 RQC domain-containing protein [Vagococcus carniphilus]MDT2853116.1 RQC domain-containing protein [Vagococcus carniphilus]